MSLRNAALLSILGISVVSLIAIRTDLPQRNTASSPHEDLTAAEANTVSSADTSSFSAASSALDRAIARGASPTVRPTGPVSGHPLSFNREAPKGLKGRIMPVSLAESVYKENDTVAFPTPDGSATTGTVNSVQAFPNGILIEGELSSGGSFSVHLSKTATSGHILFQKSFSALELRTEPSGETIMVERLLSDIICAPGIPSQPTAAIKAVKTSTKVQRAPLGPLTVPILESFPNTPADGENPEVVYPVIYLHFVNHSTNGATYDRGYWNSAKAFPVANTTLDASDISYIWARVAEDFRPFKINVTTDPAVLDKAVKSDKNWVQVWITPTKTVAPKDGGIAVLGGFSWPQQKSPEPDLTKVGARHCWAFTQEKTYCADTISHEVGHTLGLGHWGTPTAEYYAGHGEGPLSWGPIMGAGTKRVTQWSKAGSYYKQVGKGNAAQDDLAIITRAQNSVTFVSDEDQNTRSSASPLPIEDNQFTTSGVIHSATDADFYSFTTSGGTFVASCNPSPVSPNLKVRLSLLTDRGFVIATSSMDDRMESAVAEANLVSGTYYLKVEGASHLLPITSVPGQFLVREVGTALEAVGFSKYGSVGGYTLTGDISGALTPLAFTSNENVNGKVFADFNHVFELDGDSPVVSLAGTLPRGLSYNAETRTISGVPTVPNVQTLAIQRDKFKNVLAAPGLTIIPRMAVAGDGIPAGTTVASVSGTNVTLSSFTTAASTKSVTVDAITTVGKNVITLSPPSAMLVVGSSVTGTGIQDGTIVTAATASSVTLSKAASASSISTVDVNGYVFKDSASVQLTTLTPLPVVGTVVAGAGIPDNTTVTAVSKNIVTLSQPATATSTTAASFTAATTINSPTLAVKTANVFPAPGTAITGPGIPVGTIVIGVSGATATLSKNATATTATTGVSGFSGQSLATAKVSISAVVPVKISGTAAAPTDVSFTWPDDLVATSMDRYGSVVSQDVHLNIAKGGTFYSFLGSDSSLAGKGFGMNFYGVSAGPWSSQSSDLPEDTNLTETGVSGKVSSGGYSEVSVKFTATASSGLSFYWKTSSEATYDKLSVLLDGKEAAALSGEQSWNRKSLSVIAGAHTIAFRYSKDAFVTEGLDRAFVGGLEFGSVAGISKQPVSATYLATASTNPTPLSITAVIPSDEKANSVTYQWFALGTGIGDGKSWVAVNGANAAEYALAKATAGIRQYRCEITNYFGTVSSAPAIITTK